MEGSLVVAVVANQPPLSKEKIRPTRGAFVTFPFQIYLFGRSGTGGGLGKVLGGVLRRVWVKIFQHSSPF
jgi:hypothetical protein